YGVRAPATSANAPERAIRSLPQSAVPPSGKSRSSRASPSPLSVRSLRFVWRFHPVYSIGASEILPRLQARADFAQITPWHSWMAGELLRGPSLKQGRGGSPANG